MFFDSTMLLLIPAVLLSIYAQWKVKSAFANYSKVASSSGLNGAQIVDLLARQNKVRVATQRSQGHLSDHFDPSTDTIALSPEVYSRSSLASIGVAAHELGHAQQKKDAYWPLALRAGLVPIANFGSSFSIILFMIGMFAHIEALQMAGILFFSGAVLFTVITLPVEFDASRRAMVMLKESGVVPASELPGIRKTLNAAALTYVAATVMAVTELIRLVLIARSDDR